jgi:hypothetical protein
MLASLGASDFRQGVGTTQGQVGFQGTSPHPGDQTFEQAYRTVGQSEYGISPVHSTHLEK